MLTYNIIPYNKASASVKELKNNFERCTILSPNSPRLVKLLNGERTTNKHVFIKWGKTDFDIRLSELSNNPNILLLNNRDLSNYTNKLKFFETFKNTATANAYLPEVYYTKETAHRYWDTVGRRTTEDNKIILVERQSLNGTGGDGIRFLTKNTAPSTNGRLWTVYIPKKHEYRVHISKTGIIAVQKKFLPMGSAREDAHAKQLQFSLRNYANGWRYQIVEQDQVPGNVLSAAGRIINSGRHTADFCALDIIHKESNGNSFVLEANTAPGVSSPLTEKYTQYFKAQTLTHFGEQ